MTSTWVDQQAYPFHSRWLALPEGRLHYVDEGSGDPIVLVHGTPTWSFEYRHLIAGLRDSHRVVALDHLGFGLSERPAGADYTPQAHAARFRAFVDGLGLGRFTLVVHDFGGPIALPVALDDPGRVSRLIVLNSWMWSFADDPEMAKRARLASGALGRFLYRRLNASLRLITPSAYGDRRKLTRAIHRQYLAAFPDADSRERVLWALARALLGSSAFYDGLWHRRDRLAATPTLVVWGMKDSAFRPNQLARWRQALPHAAVVELPAAGHWPHEEEPARVLAEVSGFIDG
jgi:haloalkane dehalogenase